MKKLYEIELLNLQLLLEEMILDCPKCGIRREEIDFKDIPLVAQKEFKRFKGNGRFIHCPKCKSSSIIIDE